MVEINRELASLFPGIFGLLEAFQEMDTHIVTFQRATGIQCIESCAKCCELSSPKVEASVLEMIPLAIHWWEMGRADAFLKDFQFADQNHRCVLFNPSATPQKPGACSAYAFRPLMCRLFGFSAVVDKYGRSVIVLCPVLKQKQPGRLAEIQEKIDQGLKPPLYKNYARKILLIDPQLGFPLYPINEAIHRALGLIGHRKGCCILSRRLERIMDQEIQDLFPSSWLKGFKASRVAGTQNPRCKNQNFALVGSPFLILNCRFDI